jgi:hypothetical protein
MSKTDKAREHIDAALMLMKAAVNLMSREPRIPTTKAKPRAARKTRENGAAAEADKH